jgi:hypothetical protein
MPGERETAEINRGYEAEQRRLLSRIEELNREVDDAETKLARAVLKAEAARKHDTFFIWIATVTGWALGLSIGLNA